MNAVLLIASQIVKSLFCRAASGRQDAAEQILA